MATAVITAFAASLPPSSVDAATMQRTTTPEYMCRGCDWKRILTVTRSSPAPAMSSSLHLGFRGGDSVSAGTSTALARGIGVLLAALAAFSIPAFAQSAREKITFLTNYTFHGRDTPFFAGFGKGHFREAGFDVAILPATGSGFVTTAVDGGTRANQMPAFRPDPWRSAAVHHVVVPSRVVWSRVGSAKPAIMLRTVLLPQSERPTMQKKLALEDVERHRRQRSGHLAIGTGWLSGTHTSRPALFWRTLSALWTVSASISAPPA